MFDMESLVNCHASNGNKQNHVSILKLVLLSRLYTTELHCNDDGSKNILCHTNIFYDIEIVRFLIRKDSEHETTLFLNDVVKWLLSKWLSPNL